jgi:hypothetical protein
MIGKMLVFLGGMATGAWALASYAMNGASTPSRPAQRRSGRARKSAASTRQRPAT